MPFHELVLAWNCCVLQVRGLSAEQQSKGIITSSTGNHALAVLHAWATVTSQHASSCSGTTACSSAGDGAAAAASSSGSSGSTLLPPPLVYVPTTASRYKVQKLKEAGAQVVEVGTDCLESELAAGQEALANRMTYISPYNDLEVGHTCEFVVLCSRTLHVRSGGMPHAPVVCLTLQN